MHITPARMQATHGMHGYQAMTEECSQSDNRSRDHGHVTIHLVAIPPLCKIKELPPRWMSAHRLDLWVRGYRSLEGQTSGHAWACYGVSWSHWHVLCRWAPSELISHR